MMMAFIPFILNLFNINLFIIYLFLNRLYLFILSLFINNLNLFSILTLFMYHLLPQHFYQTIQPINPFLICGQNLKPASSQFP